MAYRSGERRWPAVAAALAVEAGLGLALLYGLAARMAPPAPREAALPVTFEEEARPVPPPQPPLVRSRRPEGAASPPNLRAKATEVVAPKPPIVVPVPPVVVAAPQAGVGAQASSGAADVAGPGTGSGGIGTGTGSGGSGDGDGGGWDDETPPRQTGGRLRFDGLPPELEETGFRGTVGVRYVVEVDGRARACRVTRSSGNAAVDAHTCREIERRFRFRPARDGGGRKVPSTLIENHEWEIERIVEPPPERRRGW